jgi:hypothetical protein
MRIRFAGAPAHAVAFASCAAQRVLCRDVVCGALESRYHLTWARHTAQRER